MHVPPFNRGGGGGRGQNPSFRERGGISLERVEAAVCQARYGLLSAGESVSTWKLAQSAVVSLQVRSWDSLGFRFNEVPSLRDLQFVEGKVNAFIHCFVCTRRMTSVHELGIELCKSEGVEEFDELGLGPLLRYPLIQHYFSIPPDATEVCKVTIEQLISYLTVFQYKKKYKEFKVEEFLDFLMQKYSVTSREKLGVRVQSMGMYIGFIRKIKRGDDVVRKSILEHGLPREEPQNSSYFIPEHLKSLSSPIEDFDINDITTGTLNDDSDDNEVKCSSSRQEKGKKQEIRTSKHFTDVDKMKLIGMKLAMFNYRNCEIKSPEDEEDLGSRYEISQIDPVKAMKLTLTNDELERFIMTWKWACHKHTVNEVLAMMIHIYKTSDKKKRMMERVFLSYPGVALLNIAVRFIKFGELSSLSQDFKETFSWDPISKTTMGSTDKVPSNVGDQAEGNHASADEMNTIKVKDSASMVPLCVGDHTEGNQASADGRNTINVENNISADDIIKQVASYFGLDHQPRKKDLSMEEKAVIRDCEIWLIKKNSLKDFKSLGYGCFVEFLQRHASLLPHVLLYITGDTHTKSSSLEVTMLQQQILTFLFQAATNVSDSNIITGQYISILLKKQFPSISFQLTRIEPEGSFQDIIKDQGHFDIPTSVTFSVALSGICKDTSLLPEDQHESVGALGSVSSSDAIKYLLKVPMLADLRFWSHWDLIFAPSLGPLLEWLLSSDSIKELSCIVTCDGRIIRIDNSASLDELFEALVRGSSFQAASKLLSLFFVYGGSHKIPVALLKCYCQRAFDVMIKNYTDKRNELRPSGLCDDISQINKAHAVVAMLILQCLGHLPSEFRSAVAAILIPSFQMFTRDAASIMLCVSKTPNEQVMLHDIGISLGIMEWVKDYRAFSSQPAVDLATSSETLSRDADDSNHVSNLKTLPNISNLFTSDGDVKADIESNSNILGGHDKEFCEAEKVIHSTKDICYEFEHCSGSFKHKNQEINDANLLIQKIRHEEFGLDPNLENDELSLLKKQHDRLGRALHCLSQELYSQDSHFILELVQNADDNIYSENVEPTLVFILQDAGVVVLNNEQGFSAQNIRALCDVGNSTKKGLGAGYIGKKGIGFKSVFRVSDAPEIHSNHFNIKFDITEGLIGFVLPTVISPCDIDLYKEQVCCASDQSDSAFWNTCIVLPFSSKIKEGTGGSPVISMFSDLHPSLLLFLQRLQCIKFKNMLEDKLFTMRREILKDGIIRVSHGSTQMNWLVVDKSLQASVIRPDVQTTKIAIAFTLQDSDNGDYTPDLEQQPVFAFLPLRNYGLKFILQADFVLPSSREEVDGDSAWNQWLLSEFPDLFVSAEKSFYMLPCFQESPGRAVTVFMSFVPLMGEVHGFFSQLPHMILSKLRLSNCLLLDGPNVEWTRPCRVLRNWNEEVRKFLSGKLLLEQLGLGYLCRDIILPDSLAKALGIQEYGPKFLCDLLSSICQFGDGINFLGLEWLSSWLNALYTSLNSLPVHSSGYLSSATVGTESDILNCLRRISFIPLSDGSYGSLGKGPIWLPIDVFGRKYEGENGLKHFPGLHARLQTVNPLLFSAETNSKSLEETRVDNVIRMLCKIGVQQLSAHDVIKNHILPSISAEKFTGEDADMMIEYLSFIMIHLQSVCSTCNTEKDDIICELLKKPVILTNHGLKCPTEEAIHFGKKFGNSIDVKKLIGNTDIRWNEVDSIYLKHPSTLSFSNQLSKWREFFQLLGVTNFVQVVHVEKKILDVLHSEVEKIPFIGGIFRSELFVKDWESPELAHLLCTLSSNNSSERCKYLLEVLDSMWDDYFSPKAKCYIHVQSNEGPAFDSSFMKSISKFRWVASSIDEDVHYPKELFYDSDSVRSILGALAPYAVPKVTSKRFVEDIQFKVQVTLDDALTVIQYWRHSEVSVSVSQMSKLYTFIRDELSSSKEKITEVRTSISIFVPLDYTTNFMDAVPGKFMAPDKVCWHDPTDCLDRIKETYDGHDSTIDLDLAPCIPLSHLYPGLHDFLVTDCGVLETLPSCSYLKLLLQLSRNNLPSQVAHEVFLVFLKWADDIKSGAMKSEEMLSLKNGLLKVDTTVLPTMQDKWVSLHPCFGNVCWSDDDELIKQCMHLKDVYLLQFGELTDLEKEMLSCKVAALMQNIGIRALQEVVSREAIYYGVVDNTVEASLISWAIPYVQRYLLKFYPDVYFGLKHCTCEKLARLQVITVEKLFYRFSLNGRSATSRKRYECSCLLQGTIFYTTPNVDTHSMFLELSRFFFNGTPELQTANFLHMISNKAELGSSAEQIEHFIVNNQKVPFLPDEEPPWSLSSLLHTNEKPSPDYSSLMISKKQHNQRKIWPTQIGHLQIGKPLQILNLLQIYMPQKNPKVRHLRIHRYSADICQYQVKLV